ncbi:phage holin family protein [Gemmatimonas sp.]|uniref:phage holin family protein n=1 Tax=Gemmatimonas sp. TaxID=1962908 RepID=UPI0039835319
MTLILRLLINAVALWCAARFIEGISYTGSWQGLVGLALVFGVVNTLVRPVLSFFSFPIQIITLGLFTLVLNAAMLLLTSALATRVGLPFHISGFWAALIGALLVSILSTILSWVVIPSDAEND